MRERVEELLAPLRHGGGVVVATTVAGEERTTSGGSAHDENAADGRAVFEVGSLTKPFTGALLAHMHLSGEVGLDDPLPRHLPAAESFGWNAEDVTLERLATHRSGLPNVPRGMLRPELAATFGLRRSDPWADVDERRYLEMAGRTARRRLPRGAIRYSSLAFGLLGDALAARAGRPFGDLLRERILDPLGMRDTGVDRAVDVGGRSARGRPRPELRDPMLGAGALRSSADDLMRWLEACLRPPAAPPGPALALAQEPRERAGRGMRVALGWMLLEEPGRPRIVWHNGMTYGFASFAAFVPGRDVAVAVLANSARSLDDAGFALVDAALARG